ncbi:MAG: glutamate cyclase domain-containing protein [Bacillota bacterium]
MSEEKLTRIAETLDRLVNLDISARGIIGYLYDAARRREGQPLTLAAVNLLRRSVRPGDKVFIATGWVDQPMAAPDCGESDGPPGALALARALRLALKASPVIITDHCLVEGVRRIARAAGFQCVPPENLAYSIESDRLMALSVLSFPADPQEGVKEASSLLDRLQPPVCISVERGGMNGEGFIHTMNGCCCGDFHAKLDYLFRAAGERGIATIAVGDGGNEIGMGNIADAVRRFVPYGEKCRCPCGGGLAASTKVDVLVTAAISNWGAYALAALLGAGTGVLEALNDAGMEERVLRATAEAGFHDSILGSVTPGADGCTAGIHQAMVTLLREAVLQGELRYGKV